MTTFVDRPHTHLIRRIVQRLGFTLVWGIVIVGCNTTDPLPQAEPVQLIPAPKTNRAKVRHLLLTYEGAWRSTTRRTKDNAQTQAHSYKALLDEGVDFGYLAAQYSEDPQKKDGGLIGVVEKGQMVAEFESALFDLDINEISDVVETGFGFHILQRLPLEECLLIHIEVDSIEDKELVDAGLDQGQDPRSLAQKYSIAPHGIRGGELGWFERTDLDTSFVGPVFALQIGTCTEAIARDNTWHFFCRQG